MAEFFAPRADGRGGLALFLNAGDPPLPVLAEVMEMLDEAGVDALELGVPFPDSPTDGPVIRRSARRAMEEGVGLDEALALVAAVRPRLARLRVAVFADWSHALRHRPLDEVAARVAASGADGMLAHALPPRLRAPYHDAARAAGLPLVTTCYPTSPPDVTADAAARAGAYLYLVAHYGRSGTAPPAGHDSLAGMVASLKATTTAPVAVGFGVRTSGDVARIHRLGADAAVVGSAAVACVEGALAEGDDIPSALYRLVASLRPPSPVSPTSPTIPSISPGVLP